ncbi:response regulator [Haloprofundus salinisoli]|uniref:response regulator n=1 Tax=Haloprofundus salinisoli TaxID=2876193 RepID=UPI001CCC1714|nr:response regulator [Haloprofundus salinisoli]
MSEKIEILLVEDNPGDIRLTQEAFSECKTNCQIHVTRDGEEATDFLDQRGAYADATRPDLILLDLNLPNKDGGELLTEIAEDPDVRRIPVIILSSSASEEDISNAYAHCANAYLIKPVDPLKFVSLARTVEEFWFSLAELPSTH